MRKVWKWVATTSDGIYHGELLGIQEQGETDRQAMQSVSSVVKDFIWREIKAIVITCFVSDTTIFIDAANTSVITLDIDQVFHATELDEKDVMIQAKASIARLPKHYPMATFTRHSDGYSFLIGDTIIFRSMVSGKEAVKGVEDYVAERDRYSDLPVGVRYGIYD